MPNIWRVLLLCPGWDCLGVSLVGGLTCSIYPNEKHWQTIRDREAHSSADGWREEHNKSLWRLTRNPLALIYSQDQRPLATSSSRTPWPCSQLNWARRHHHHLRLISSRSRTAFSWEESHHSTPKLTTEEETIYSKVPFLCCLETLLLHCVSICPCG